MEPHKHPHLAGLLLFIGSAQFVLAMVVEELLLPGYNPSRQPISDLGNTTMYPTHAPIFNTSVFLIGGISLISAILLYLILTPTVRGAFGIVFLGLAGLGAMGVGLSPENVNGTYHAISAFAAFFFGGLALIVLAGPAREYVGKRWVSPFMVIGGFVDIGALVAFVAVGSDWGGAYYGAIERVIVVPVLLWAMVFGVLLMARPVSYMVDVLATTSPRQAANWWFDYTPEDSGLTSDVKSRRVEPVDDHHVRLSTEVVQLGRKVRVDGVVTLDDPFSLRFDGKVFVQDAEFALERAHYVFHAEGKGTRISANFELEGTSVLRGLVLTLVHGRIRDERQKAFNELGAALSKETAAPASARASA